MTSIATYRGPIDANELGCTLMHEHVFVVSHELAANYPEFLGWDPDVAIANAVARLEELRTHGIDSIVDLTVLGLGRHPTLVQAVAEQTPINIIGATGMYVLRDAPSYLWLRGPGLLFDEPDPLIKLFIDDLTTGMASSGVRAGMLKCAIGTAGLTTDVRRVLRAVAIAHLETGAPITAHTDARSRSGLELQRALREEGVDLTRVVIGHSGDTTDLDYLQELIDRGSYLGMDRFGFDLLGSVHDRVAVVVELCRRGHADRMVLSHDAVCHHDGFHADSMRRVMPNYEFCHISRDVLPALREAGVSDEDLRQMMVLTPAAILSSRS